jgi:HSP20 family protein
MKSTLTPTTQNPRSLSVTRETDWPLYSLQRAMNHIFQDFFSDGESFYSPAIFSEELSKFTPRVDLSETDKEYTVKAELPGINQNDIDISISRDMLTLRGEKKQEKEENVKGYHRMERSYGSFCRTIALPTEIETDKAEATFKNGVLNIKLPKTKEAQQESKKLTIKAG